MIKSRGQKNEQKEEDSRSNNQYYNTESKIDGSSIGGSGNKEQAEKVEEKYENSDTNTHSSTLDNDINTQKKLKTKTNTYGPAPLPCSKVLPLSCRAFDPEPSRCLCASSSSGAPRT